MDCANDAFFALRTNLYGCSKCIRTKYWNVYPQQNHKKLNIIVRTFYQKEKLLKKKYCSCIGFFFWLQVEYWKSRVDRQCIERLKNFQNPPMLVGHVMEMVMTLIGKKSINKDRGEYPSKDEQSGRYSASSGSTKYTVGKKSKLLIHWVLVKVMVFYCLHFNN